MANLFVKPGNVVEHDGVRYGEHEDAGSKVSDLTEEQAQALLDAGVASEDKAEADAETSTSDEPTPEEVAAAAAEAGQPAPEAAKRGILNFGK